ncbi:AraC family transcriptional regulator [Sphingobacterium suaedae]|uniref:AraC family transcriptional regulator n=1 Tax=Sphingobacterium suaedae TaxID=1686402 RepID=A0ABW5KK20_9SPHI
MAKQDVRKGFDGEMFFIASKDPVRDYNCAFSYYITDIGYFPRAHNHFRSRGSGCDQHIWIHCVDGEGRVWLGDTVYKLKRNEFILIPAHTPHAYQADLNDPWTIYWMHFKGAEADKVASNLLQRTHVKQNKGAFTDEMRTLFEKMYQAMQRSDSLETYQAVDLILPYFFSFYLYPGFWKEIAYTDDDHVIASVIQYLQQDLEAKVTLQDLADRCHLSVSHFSKLFKRKTGYSPIDYANHIKIQKACYLLRYSSRRIGDIAIGLGFTDPFYFSRVFKDQMGLSPSEFRAENALNQE